MTDAAHRPDLSDAAAPETQTRTIPLPPALGGPIVLRPVPIAVARALSQDFGAPDQDPRAQSADGGVITAEIYFKRVRALKAAMPKGLVVQGYPDLALTAAIVQAVRRLLEFYGRPVTTETLEAHLTLDDMTVLLQSQLALNGENDALQWRLLMDVTETMLQHLRSWPRAEPE